MKHNFRQKVHQLTLGFVQMMKQKFVSKKQSPKSGGGGDGKPRPVELLNLAMGKKCNDYLLYFPHNCGIFPLMVQLKSIDLCRKSFCISVVLEELSFFLSLCLFLIIPTPPERSISESSKTRLWTQD